MVREGADADRRAVLDLFHSDFGRTQIMAFGDLMRLDDAPALVAEMQGELAGALAYRLRGDALQIVALATDPAWQRSGVGGYLVAEAELMARRLSLRTMVFSTTNDNLPSLYFYQRRGYVISEVVVGAMTGLNAPPHDRGFGGVPVRDEIRLSKTLA